MAEGETRARPSRGVTARRGRLGALDLLAVGTMGLRTRRLRAVLSALGIAIAIATVIVVTSIPASSQAALDIRLSALGSDLLRADPAPHEPPVTLPPEAVGMLQRIGPVTGAATVANLHLPVRSNPLRSQDDAGTTALAVDGALLSLVRGTMASGGWLDDDTVTPSVVLGSDAAARLGIPRLPARAVQIDIGGVAFTVIGVLAPTPLAGDLQSAVLVTRHAAEARLGYDGRATVAYVTAEEDAVDRVRPIVAATLSPEASGRVTVGRASDVLAAKQETRTAFDGLFLGLAGVSLLVGGIGIANTMFVSVLERRREIGLRRALGAHRGQIRAQFLTEAVALSLLGGMGGLVLGSAAAAGWAVGHDWPLVVPAATVLSTAAASLATGILAGLAPSIRASRQSPTAALASE